MVKAETDCAEAGINDNTAFSLGFGNTAIQMSSVFFCWILTSYFGRRTLYLWGVAFNFFFLLATGIVASVPRTATTSWLQAVFLILIYAQYGLTIGPVTYAVIAETSSVRLRAKAVGLSRNFYYIWSVISGISEYPLSWCLDRADDQSTLTCSILLRGTSKADLPTYGLVPLPLSGSLVTLVSRK